MSVHLLASSFTRPILRNRSTHNWRPSKTPCFLRVRPFLELEDSETKLIRVTVPSESPITRFLPLSLLVLGFLYPDTIPVIVMDSGLERARESEGKEDMLEADWYQPPRLLRSVVQLPCLLSGRGHFTCSVVV